MSFGQAYPSYRTVEILKMSTSIYVKSKRSLTQIKTFIFIAKKKFISWDKIKVSKVK